MMENFLFFPLKGWGWILFYFILFFELCLRVVIINHMQVDENLQRQKDIDEWLPITSSRNAKWWYSAFHNVTAMVGAGVLGLPYAIARLGWYICLKQTQYSSWVSYFKTASLLCIFWLCYCLTKYGLNLLKCL